MHDFDLKEHSHTRYNILTGEWVLVSPHRTKRPWQGKVEAMSDSNRPAYEPECYLCPGNKRADGSLNPVYDAPFVFTNDFSALLPDTPTGSVNLKGLIKAESTKGRCRVISFSPDHSLTLPQLSEQQIQKVVDLWCDEFNNIATDPSIRYIQIFENKGDIMGCSNPHPHGQIWSQNTIPVEIHKETLSQQYFYQEQGQSLLQAYLNLELELKERIVVENDDFVALVPFWAIWPYETMIISKRHVPYIIDLTKDERKSFSDVIKRVTTKYDNLFDISFPYSAGIHQAPVNDGNHPEWHLHMHFYPPLLRSATVKKFMVGYEMMANAQRDITPEYAAERLRELSEVHYKQRKSGTDD
jgi:UDPglucose--hexose-1-phosphate uridylyltransferase